MKRYLPWLICFTLLRGLAYLIITPPWQAPDETTHFQFMKLLTERSLSEIQKINVRNADGNYYGLERKILESMKKHEAWKYVNLPTPDPLPGGFWKAPFFEGSVPKIYRPPLYYLLGAEFLKSFRLKDLETELYVARFYSLFLSIGTVILSYFIGLFVFKEERYGLITGMFVSFLPQFMVIGASVNSDNLVNLLTSAFLLYAVFLLRDRKSGSYLILIPFFLLTIFFSGKTGAIIAPITVFLYVFQMKKLKKHLDILILTLLILASSTFLIQSLWPRMILRTYQIMKVSFEEIHLGLTRDLGFYHYFSILLFKSFWFVGGWMVIQWNRWVYAFVGILSIFSILGFSKDLFNRITKKEQDLALSNPLFFLMTFTVLLAIGQSLVYYGFIQGVLAQGRYLFPALPAFAILFIYGLKKVTPQLLVPYLPMGFAIVFSCLDVYTLFGCLLPYYHFS